MSEKMLSSIYDQLLGDREGTRRYAEFVLHHKQGDTLCELACGSGDLLLSLADSFTQSTGVDIDSDMIGLARNKPQANRCTWIVKDMLSFTASCPFSTVLCVGDSLNYLENQTQLATCLDNMMRLSDASIILDLHHPSRLQEFAQPYIEEGYVAGIAYQWVIEGFGDCLYHHFTFFTEIPIQESVVQRIFDPQWVADYVAEKGWSCSWYTDFKAGYLPEGEKVMLDIRRRKI